MFVDYFFFPPLSYATDLYLIMYMNRSADLTPCVQKQLSLRLKLDFRDLIYILFCKGEQGERY